MDGHVTALNPARNLEQATTDTIDRLLAQAEAEHAAYQKAAKAQDYRTAEASVARALAARLEAHDLDPDHVYAGWRDQSLRTNRVSHDELIRFYRHYPEIP